MVQCARVGKLKFCGEAFLWMERARIFCSALNEAWNLFCVYFLIFFQWCDGRKAIIDAGGRCEWFSSDI
jgi:hypothetical protein